MNGPVSPELLGRLLDQYGGALALFAARWTDQADDCVQEAFVELAGQRSMPDNPPAWLFHVVRNRALTAARSARRRRKHETEAAAFIRAVDAEAVGEIRPDEIGEAVHSLPDELRDAVIARVWGGLGYEALGNLLAVSTATAHRRCESALAMLREKLGVACPPKKKT